MINIPTILRGLPLEPTQVQDITRVWKVGEILHARAETGSDTQGKLQLRVGQYLMDAVSPLPLKAGDKLVVQVKQLTEPAILKILNLPTESPNLSHYLRQSPPQERALSVLAQTMSILLKPPLDASTPPLPSGIANALRALIKQLPDTQTVSTSEGLKQAILDSGMSLESRLRHAGQGNNFPSDLKAALSHLDNAIKRWMSDNGITNAGPASTETQQAPKATFLSRGAPLPPPIQWVSLFIKGEISITTLASGLLQTVDGEQIGRLISALPPSSLSQAEADTPEFLSKLLKHIGQQPNGADLANQLARQLHIISRLQELQHTVEQGLAHITSNQLISVAASQDNPLLLLFSLLVGNEQRLDILDLRIAQEPKPGKETEEKTWVVTIHFRFPELGDMHAELRLRGEQLATHIRASEKATADLVNRELPKLQSALVKAGFGISHLGCSQGQPREENRYSLLTGPLLDERA